LSLLIPSLYDHYLVECNCLQFLNILPSITLTKFSYI
jgi:hypothetical protein